jgi:hypothetical protein
MSADKHRRINNLGGGFQRVGSGELCCSLPKQGWLA